MNFCVISTGSVSPGGEGSAGLRGAWRLESTANGRGSASFEVGRVDRGLPGLVSVEGAARLRRASPITRFMMGAAAQALEAAPEVDRARIGIVACFFLGCIDYSVRFFRQITNDGRRYGSPLIFPETVFNSPASHVAATLGIGGPVYSQVGDKACWVSGLRTAACWLQSGAADHVLVLGAEEFDPHELDAFHAAGWLRRPCLIPCEGSGAVLLGRGAVGGLARLTGLAPGGYFGKRAGAAVTARASLAELPAGAAVLQTGTGWTARVEEGVVGERMVPRLLPAHHEGFTASAAWDMIRAVEHVGRAPGVEELVVPCWGLSQQFAAAVVAPARG